MEKKNVAEMLETYEKQMTVDISSSAYECYWDEEWYDSEQGGWVDDPDDD